MNEREKEIITLACQQQIASLLKFLDPDEPLRLLMLSDLPDPDMLEPLVKEFIEELEIIQEQPEFILDCSWLNAEGLKHILKHTFKEGKDTAHLVNNPHTENILINLYLKGKLNLENFQSFKN